MSSLPPPSYFCRFSQWYLYKEWFHQSHSFSLDYQLDLAWWNLETFQSLDYKWHRRIIWPGKEQISQTLYTCVLTLVWTICKTIISKWNALKTKGYRLKNNTAGQTSYASLKNWAFTHQCNIRPKLQARIVLTTVSKGKRRDNFPLQMTCRASHCHHKLWLFICQQCPPGL